MRVVLIDEQCGADARVRAKIRDSLRRAGALLRVGPGDVVVRLTQEEEMARLNERWRGKSRATDVISFPSNSVDPAGRKHIGDIAICLDVARRQARERGHGAGREAALLALHGLLHLLGHDHETDGGEMERIERRLRRVALEQR